MGNRQSSSASKVSSKSEEPSSPSPNLQRADCAGLNMSNMSEVTFDHCTFSISELQRAQSAGINMFNMSQVTFQHCTFSQYSGEVSSSSSVSLKSDQSEEDISNIKESSSLRMGNRQSSSASKVSSKSEEPSSPRLDFTSSSMEVIGRGDQEESTESSVSCESDKSKKDIINFKESSSPSPEELLRAEQLIMLGMISAVLLCFLLSQEESTESSVSCESDKSKKDIINFKESSSPSPNLQRADCAGLNMSNMSEVTFDHCTFSISELQRAQSAGINMFNMSQVTFQHCTFSQCSGEVSSSSSVSLKSDQSEEDISNIKESSSLRMGNSQSSSASKVSSKSEEPSSPSDEDLRGDVTSDCPGV